MLLTFALTFLFFLHSLDASLLILPFLLIFRLHLHLLLLLDLFFNELCHQHIQLQQLLHSQIFELNAGVVEHVYLYEFYDGAPSLLDIELLTNLCPDGL